MNNQENKIRTSVSMKTMDKLIYGWHFAAFNMRLFYGDNREIQVGETLSINLKPICSKQGLHSSTCILEALQYRGLLVNLCRVVSWGDTDRLTTQLAAKNRHTLWVVNFDEVMKQSAINLTSLTSMAIQEAKDRGVFVEDYDPRSNNG